MQEGAAARSGSVDYPPAMSTQPATGLETFANPAPERDYTIRMSMPEFTCLCPRTGQPDFATLELEYVADRLCVELKSLKLYLQRFRNEGIFYEQVVNRLLDDFVAACAPVRCQVVGNFTPRGGITTNVTCRYEASTKCP